MAVVKRGNHSKLLYPARTAVDTTTTYLVTLNIYIWYNKQLLHSHNRMIIKREGENRERERVLKSIADTHAAATNDRLADTPLC